MSISNRSSRAPPIDVRESPALRVAAVQTSHATIHLDHRLGRTFNAKLSFCGKVSMVVGVRIAAALLMGSPLFSDKFLSFRIWLFGGDHADHLHVAFDGVPDLRNERWGVFALLEVSAARVEHAT